ncbi:MAG: iron ABC transporter permease [Gemmatimonadetes bacterium]|nr:MAG: iron ABC transporter permease [Gemmatimonadota bacterium]
MRRVSTPVAFAAALLLLAGLVFLDLAYGSVRVGPGELLRVLAGGGDATAREVVLGFRLPRVALAALVGGGLALAGALFQALLRNPLAEPYILGVSGGAAAGAVTVLAAGLAGAASAALPAAAFLGALLAVVLVFRVAVAAGGRLDVRVLLLAGVAIGVFFSAYITFVLAVSDADTVRGAVYWMMGALGDPGWPAVLVAAAYTLPACALALALARPLDLMAAGEESATYLGLKVEPTKRLAYGVASLLAAAGVAAAGVIGFVGLVVPHVVRLTAGSAHRRLLPISFVGGAAFLIGADLLANVLLAPTRLPIGVATAFIGVPVFLVLLRRTLGASS